MIRRLPALLLAALLACGGSSTPPTLPSLPGAPPAPDPVATDEPAAPAPVQPVAAVGHPRADLIPRAVLFGNPERGAPQISPDGRWLAFSAPAAGVMNVFVAPTGDLTKATQVTFDKVRPVRSYQWSNDGRWVVYTQDVGGDENFHVFRVGPDGKDALARTPRPGVAAQIVGTSSRRVPKASRVCRPASAADAVDCEGAADRRRPRDPQRARRLRR